MLAIGACGDSAAEVPTASATPTTTVEELLPMPGALVGPVEDSDLFIAVVPGEDGTVEAYSCDGTDTSGTVDQWFRGAWDGRSRVALTGGDFELSFEHHTEAISGHLTTPGGDVLAFRATPAEEGEGLHVLERRDATTGEVIDRGGLIVNDNDRRGAMAPFSTQCRYIAKRRYDVVTGQYIEYVVQVCF